MLLFHFPELGHLYLLVRPKEGQTAEERFWAQIAPSAVFDPLRERYGSEYEAFLREKITPVAGDVVLPELGIDASFVSAEGPITAVVNVAGVVDFNPPLDEALDVNAFGVNNLVDLAKRLGAPVMHTSTCYVAGYREGLIEEVDPREIPFPAPSVKRGTAAETRAAAWSCPTGIRSARSPSVWTSSNKRGNARGTRSDRARSWIKRRRTCARAASLAAARPSKTSCPR
jgi:thioester reductase-like protein